MKNPKHNKTQSIRIPVDYYSSLRKRAEQNKRPVVSELVMILDEALHRKTIKSDKLKIFAKVSGLIKDLPKENYSQTVDNVLYGDCNE